MSIHAVLAGSTHAVVKHPPDLLGDGIAVGGIDVVGLFLDEGAATLLGDMEFGEHRHAADVDRASRISGRIPDCIPACRLARFIRSR